MAQHVLCCKKIRNSKSQSKRYIYNAIHVHAPEATPRPEILVRPRESSVVVLVLDAVSADGCRGHEGVGSRRCCCCGGCRIRPRPWPPQAAGPPDAFALDLGALNLGENLSEADALDGRQRGTYASDDDMVMDSDDD